MDGKRKWKQINKQAEIEKTKQTEEIMAENLPVRRH